MEFIGDFKQIETGQNTLGRFCIEARMKSSSLSVFDRLSPLFNLPPSLSASENHSQQFWPLPRKRIQIHCDGCLSDQLVIVLTEIKRSSVCVSSLLFYSEASPAIEDIVDS
jgi:hypothetical protein